MMHKFTVAEALAELQAALDQKKATECFLLVQALLTSCEHDISHLKGASLIVRIPPRNNIADGVTDRLETLNNYIRYANDGLTLA